MFEKFFSSIREINSSTLSVVLLTISLVAVALISIVLIIYFSKFYGVLSPDHADWGTFGDYVGGTLNPILSFLALLALLLTIVLQNRELEASHEELRLTREELERSREAQEKQGSSTFRVEFIQETVRV